MGEGQPTPTQSPTLPGQGRDESKAADFTWQKHTVPGDDRECVVGLCECRDEFARSTEVCEQVGVNSSAGRRVAVIVFLLL